MLVKGSVLIRYYCIANQPEDFLLLVSSGIYYLVNTITVSLLIKVHNA